ncbi:transcriptional repressor NrdR [Collinsella tanakaei]|uniref:Transcriptional repressor NrdR n=1 Tax=Collinsella ihumii TaxID=1720204 RepID=A0A921LQS6_9ACTN|nr:transcriptional regulator NrdR [Collinsella ihumii]MBM6688242.1 transcriptional repressor NrdR [Collinsella tanakaei]MBM6775743.1 transcriptional repressor NrdR [Collinsella tanakaei]MBM6785841.1 transcriptional repressor NrdR [Collinsella tanakaei]MBM6905870.1 transcriptional repressor NrdR [Collinsella tanakaei]MCF6414107.1 transcriptional repressor NrdR [Collinsella tanakaei]
MRCPKCGFDDTRVVDSRTQEATNAIKRRRECRKCGYRFTTFERCEDPIEVLKSDGSIQPFDRNKLLVGLMRATSKRDIDLSALNGIIDDIERELRGRTLTAVSSHELGDMVLKRLQKIDKVAYIRFASVYRDFQDVDEFIEELDKIR